MIPLNTAKYSLIAGLVLSGIHYESHFVIWLENSAKNRISYQVQAYGLPILKSYGFEPVSSAVTTSEAPTTLRDLAREESLMAGENPDLVAAIIQIESRWDSSAVSEAGALGLMQVMPEHAKKFCHLPHQGHLLNPKENLQCGLKVLTELRSTFKSIRKVLTVWNQGWKCKDQPCEKGNQFADQVLNTLAG